MVVQKYKDMLAGKSDSCQNLQLKEVQKLAMKTYLIIV